MFEFLKTKRMKAKEEIGPFLAREASREYENFPLFCQHCGRKTTINFSPRYSEGDGKLFGWKYEVGCLNHAGPITFQIDRIWLDSMKENLPPEDFEKVLAAIEVLC